LYAGQRSDSFMLLFYALFLRHRRCNDYVRNLYRLLRAILKILFITLSYAQLNCVQNFRKIRVYLISRFFSIRENRENFMLAKYTWFTVL